MLLQILSWGLYGCQVVQGQRYGSLHYYCYTIVLLKLIYDGQYLVDLMDMPTVINAASPDDCLVLIIWLQVRVYSNRNLLAVPVGITQKDNVDDTVQKVFLIIYYIIEIIGISIPYLISLISVSYRKFYNYFIPLWWQCGWMVGS